MLRTLLRWLLINKVIPYAGGIQMRVWSNNLHHWDLRLITVLALSHGWHRFNHGLRYGTFLVKIGIPVFCIHPQISSGI